MNYNSCLQMASYGTEHEVHHDGFQPMFIVQGQYYHNTGALLPQTNQQHTCWLIYFIGNDVGCLAQINIQYVVSTSQVCNKK